MDAPLPGAGPPRARQPEGYHTILHTSGTTGMPKGVIYSDRLWLANMASYPGNQVCLSYMPLAYITDRHTVYTTLWNGGRVGIITPLELSPHNDFDKQLFEVSRE